MANSTQTHIHLSIRTSDSDNKRLANRKKPSRRSTGGKKPYTHPVPARNALLEHLQQAGRPLPEMDILEAFAIRGAKQRRALTDQLKGMVRAGQIHRNRHGDYCLSDKLELVFGAVRGHPDGFGFVVPDDGSERVHLSAREMRALLDGDRVTAKIEGQDRRGRPYGRVVEVVERGATEIAGQFIRERGIALVIPDNPKISHRILIPKGETNGARPGQIVVARILDYPTEWQQATGTVAQILGDPSQKGIATDIAIHAHGIPVRWPKPVREQADAYGPNVPTAAKKGREDLRGLDLITIDGADARDFDDAVFCEPTASGWRLLVAIADVAHYVTVDSPLDKEATRRGTSVYFPDRVVPMLPEALSNGLCSLNPKVDRLCMVCEMRINGEGKVTRSRFFDAVMRSTARLTYAKVNAYLEGEPKHQVPKAAQSVVRDLHELYRAFARRRQKRGAIELDIPQTRIRMDDEGGVADIRAVERNDAHRLIEECMIAANVQAAKFLRRHKIQGLYRVHAKPDPESFSELREFLSGLGFKVPHPEHVKPGDFNKLLRNARGRVDSSAISMTMLRSLPHAEYTPQNIGHFGLALDAYAHFTSPIRRYPDLLVHRAIRHITQGGKPGRYHYPQDAMERLGSITSAHERRAEEATREVEALLKCQYMEEKLGERFSGMITGVTNFGVFVQIEDLMVDGLIHVSSLDNDYYSFDAGGMQLVGERSGRVFALGDKLEVEVQRVDLETRRIDFRLAETTRRRGGTRRVKVRR